MTHNILIVEDMRDWRDQLSSVLRRDGHRVTAAASYVEALSALKQNEYHLVIVDLRLSPSDENNRDGMLLLADLQDLKIPAIVVSGYSTADLARQAFRDYGTLDFLEKKDLELSELRKAVRDAFARADQMEAELRELRARFLRGETIRMPSRYLEPQSEERPEHNDV